MSSAIQLVGAGLVLAVTVVVGTITHEFSHAFALRVFGVRFEMSWLPERDRTGLLRASIAGDWAAVRPRALPHDFEPWRLRVAAMMPLVLAVPLPLVALGVLPDPFASGNPYEVAVALGWLACALPSPQDFSLLWHAERAIEESPPAEMS